MTVLRNQRFNQIAVLTGVLVIAAVLRFASLDQRGLIYWDEAKFALEGLRLHAYIQSWFGSSPVDAGKTIGTAKPTHALLIALAYFVLGVHTYSPLFLNAFCSVVAVGVVFLIGRRLFGPWVGLVAALLLAVSEYDVIYARSALSESDANLLFLLAVFFWVIDWERLVAAVSEFKVQGSKINGGPGSPGAQAVAATDPSASNTHTSDRRSIGPTRMLILSGLLAGLAFTANYRLGIYVLVLVVFDLVWVVREYGFRAIIRRFTSWLPSCAAVPLLWQLADLIARGSGHVLFRSEVNIVVNSGKSLILKSAQQNQPEYYLQQALFQLHGSKGSAGLHFDPGIYLQWFFVREGWVIPILLVAGLVMAIRFRQLAWMALASLVVFPYVVYVFAPYVVPRNLDAAIPFVCLLSAAALVTAAERIPRDLVRRVTVVGLGCAIAVYGGVLTWRLTGERSGIAQAAAYVQSHGGKALSSNEIMVWYLPGPATGTTCLAPGLPSTKPQLAADRAAGYRYAETETIDHGMAAWLAGYAKLVGRWPAWGNIKIGENPVGTENGYPPVQNPEYVMLYDLKGLALPPPGNASVTQCIRNVPI